MWTIIEQEICQTEATRTSRFRLSIVLEVLDWLLLVWKAVGVLKIGFQKWFFLRALEEISALSSQEHWAYFPQRWSKASWQLHHFLIRPKNRPSKSPKGHSHCFPGEWGQDVSAPLFKILRFFAWLWFYQHVAVPLLLFISRKTKQNKTWGEPSWV